MANKKDFAKFAQNQFDEDVLLSSILKYGRDGYADCCDLINENHFKDFLRKSIYGAISQSFSNQEPFSTVTIFQKLGLSESKFEEVKEILSSETCPQESLRTLANTLRKKQIIQDAISIHRECIDNLITTEPTAKLSEIMGVTENALFDLVSKSALIDNNPTNLGAVARNIVDEWISCPVENVGIPLPWPKFNTSIGGGLRTGVHIIGARLKALRHGSKVYTNNGPVSIETIKVGDIIKHPFKGETKVTAVWPHKNKDIYRVYFRDGDFVDCCEDHLWHVYKRYPHNNNTEYLKTTKELMNDLTVGNKQKYKWDVPLPSPVDFDHKDVPIDPYALGILLGDGSVSNNTCVYHTADDEIHQYMLNYAKSIGCEVKIDSNRPDNKVVSYRINSFQNKLRESGIWGLNCYNKKIPKNYIYNSQEVRLGVLAGMLDTDGTCVIDKRSNGGSRTKYSSVSYQLCLDLKEIVQSLGGLCSITNITSMCNGKSFHSYSCEVRLPYGVNPFKLTRKAAKFKNRVLGKLKRTIVKIEKVGIDNATCLTLADNDGLFMTDNYVVTHNTGKSSFGALTAINTACNLGIPTLIIDTEMKAAPTLSRMLASMSEVKIRDIETGKFSFNEFDKKQVYNAVEVLEKSKICHKHMGGAKFDEILSTIRRWIYTDVGFQINGEANPMLLIFDYFKIMDASDITGLSETQALGFQISNLVDMANKYNFPCLSFAQLNRDGISREDSGAVGASDRLAQLANSLSIFKRKTEEEYLKDGPENGNRKMITTDSRYGGEVEFASQYISMNMKKDYCIIQEVNFEREKKAEF